jgi:hypothetical protein
MPNTQRQPSDTCTQPPMMGAMAGASENTSMVLLISRCALVPSNRSRTTARATVGPMPAARPCSTRQNSSVPKVGARKQPTEPAVYSTSPPITTRRRPSASDSGPCTSEKQAKGSR